MPISTDLSVSPYFDDFDTNKDFYKVLFRPGVAVQTRELNQLQSILQNQIENFGDHVFKRGTIIDGCDITFQRALPYVKIRDIQVDGAPANVNEFINYYVKDTANVSPLVASVQTAIDGFETTNNPKTLYVMYINTGYANVAGVETARAEFVANDTLTVYNPQNPIEKILSSNNSAGFSNSDSVVILSAIAVQNSTNGTTFANTFAANSYLTDGTANVQIVAVDTTSNTEAVILQIKPYAVDLVSGNTAKWSLALNSTVQANVGEAVPSSQAKIVGFVGTGAQAVMRTGTINGEVDTITVNQGGSGYYVLPTVSIKSSTANTSQTASANLIPQTFLTNINIGAVGSSPVGSGYGVSVGQGVIYQKGYFSRVNEHMVIVEKYANTGFNKAVGFDTTEAIINSNQDASLLDNATGEPNSTAPGANRLQLTPVLVVKEKAEADANTDFLSIVEFSDGNPYKQIQQTQYNIIGQELAKRTFEESGNYVIDPFLISTIPANTIANEATQFRVSIDPGVGYVNGNRIESSQSFVTNVDKGTDTFVANNANISLNYGNYIRVDELSGIFKFNVGDLVSLYPTAANFISGGNAGTTPSAAGLGTTLGTARIRSLVLESGTPGTSTAIYRLYLFDIQLAAARNFKLVRSIFYNGTYKGVSDAILEGGDAVLKDNNLSSLLYYAGRPAVKNGNNFSYVYRTINDSGDIKLTTGGTITLSAVGNETFPYTAGAVLSSAQEQDIIITPLANARFTANASGSVSCNATSTQVNGVSTSFTTQFQAGDYVYIGGSIVRQVKAIANDTIMTLTTNGTSQASANLVMYFPQFVPVSLRADRTANVDAESNTIIINLGASVNVETNVAVAFNVRSADTTPVTKTVNRDQYVRLQLSNNISSNTGPWALGVPDIFHLKGVFLGSNNSFGPASANVTDITNQFYIDHNQTEDYYDMSYLYRKTNANTAVANTSFLLVKFDYFTNSGEGLKAPGSAGTYNINDGIALASSASSINTLEIPEVFSVKGTYYDLRDQFDFRPVSVANTTPNATPASAPINPAVKTSADKFGTTDKKFPAPNSDLTGIIEYYQGRVDRVTVDENSDFNILRGSPDSTEAPEAPNDSLTINTLRIPPYPSQPLRPSAATVEFIDNKMANELYSNRRLRQYQVTAPLTSGQRLQEQPRGYTMVDIGSLENRIEALEYYVSFTLVETLVQKKVIPSSSNNSIDRFKFGYFVDGFNSYEYAQLADPQYNASIVDGFLSPRAEEINLPLRSVGFSGGAMATSLPYFETPFITQTGATDGPIAVTPPPTPPPAANVDTGTVTVRPTFTGSLSSSGTVSRVSSVVRREINRNNSDSGAFFDEFFYTFSQSAGNPELFIVAPGVNVGAIVYQSRTSGTNASWTPIRNSGSNASAIETNDVYENNLTPSQLGGQTVIHPGTIIQRSNFFAGTDRWIQDQFKMTWTHNPVNGIYYKIRVYKGAGTRWNTVPPTTSVMVHKLEYVVDADDTGTLSLLGGSSTTFDASQRLSTLRLTDPSGKATMDQSSQQSWYNPTATMIGLQPGARAGEERFEFTVTGLKPDTTHNFFVGAEPVNVNDQCKPAGGKLGDRLRTDRNGTLSFAYYNIPTIQSTNAITAAASALELVASPRTVTLQDASRTSTARGVILVSNYIKSEVTGWIGGAPDATAGGSSRFP